MRASLASQSLVPLFTSYAAKKMQEAQEQGARGGGRAGGWPALTEDGLVPLGQLLKNPEEKLLPVGGKWSGGAGVGGLGG